MSLTPEAITALRAPMELEQINEHLIKKEIDAIAMPAGFSIADMEKYRDGRRRLTGKMTTSSIESFKEYVDAFNADKPMVFIDHQKMAACCVLNFGDVDNPGHADHCATLKLEATSAYLAMQKVAQQGRQAQRATAEWCEDYADFIRFLAADGVGHIQHAVAIKAIRNLKIESAAKATSGMGSFSQEKSLLESTKVDTSEGLPHYIRFTCIPYKDLEERDFTLRLGVGADSSNNTVFTVQTIRHDLAVQEMAEELAGLVRANMASASVFLGEFAK